jgi:hypothetical protein
MSYHVTIKKRWNPFTRIFCVERVWHEKGLGKPTLAISLDTGEYLYMDLADLKEIRFHADYHSHKQSEAKVDGGEHPKLEN